MIQIQASGATHEGDPGEEIVLILTKAELLKLAMVRHLCVSPRPGVAGVALWAVDDQAQADQLLNKIKTEAARQGAAIIESFDTDPHPGGRN